MRSCRHAVEGGVRRCRACTAFMDGRDVPPSSGDGYMQQLQDFDRPRAVSDGTAVRDGKRLRAATTPWIATSVGTASPSAYEAVVVRRAPLAASDGRRRRHASLLRMPRSPTSSSSPWRLTIAACVDGDAVVFFNFRPDRAREITRRPRRPDAFDGFDRRRRPQVALRVPDRVRPGDPRAGWPSPRQFPENVLADVLAAAGPAPVPYRRDREVRACHVLPQRRSRGARRRGSSRRLIPSPKVATYDSAARDERACGRATPWPRPSMPTRPTCTS